ncbi:DNA-methyltransferase [Enterovirga rhinocerotis]|uniref:DNA-methyltransferase n=1 Tax=Enterovirga rhinocerotis TaxID=1339210 RepID=UPI001FE0278C|nr:site-specific DNA-methyltransferase [Enterovirga rhinocerotis]
MQQRARPGDLWALGPHRIVCGDATDPRHVGLALGGARPNLMVTDPPYGVSYDPAWREWSLGKAGVSLGTVANDNRADWREAWALFPGDVAYVWHGALFGSVTQDALRAAGFLVRSQIIWRKQHFAISRGAYHWMHEPCWYAVRRGRTAYWTGDRKQRTVWDIANATGWRSIDDGRTGHATQKPLECMRRPMRNHSRPGDLVYDPFLGSGSTLIAAEELGRICLGLELMPAYVDLVLDRWERFTGRTAERIGAFAEAA